MSDVQQVEDARHYHQPVACPLIALVAYLHIPFPIAQPMMVL